MQDAVECRSQDVDPDREGVDIVLPNMRGEQLGEDEAAKDEGHNGYAHSCQGRKDPDRKNEGTNAETEVRRNVDLLIKSRLPSVIAFWTIPFPIDAVVVLVNLEEDIGSFGKTYLIRGGCANVSPIPAEVNIHLGVLDERLAWVVSLHYFHRIALEASKYITPGSSNAVPLFVHSSLVKQEP